MNRPEDVEAELRDLARAQPITSKPVIDYITTIEVERDEARAMAVTDRRHANAVTRYRDEYLARAEAAEAKIAALEGDQEDARRYRRLRVLGCAVMDTPQLEQGTVVRFTGLDAIIDADLSAVPSRGEARAALQGVEG